MPLYDYKCEDCGHINKDEYVKKLGEKVVCGSCGSENTKPQFPLTQPPKFK